MVDVREVDFVVDFGDCEFHGHGIKVYNTITELTYYLDFHRPVIYMDDNVKVVKQYQIINLRYDK